MQRVLIAEPDLALARLYGEALEKDGFEVTTAGNGLDCLARLREFQPDILVLEPDLPWGSGEGVLALLAEDVTLRPAVVVVLGRALDPKRLLAWQGVIQSWHTKPLLPLRLVGILREAGCCVRV
jgi:DNA-binding response OmpR family regulator